MTRLCSGIGPGKAFGFGLLSVAPLARLRTRQAQPCGIQDLHVLPKFSDGWSYLYVEHCRVDQEDRAIAVHDASGKVPVPCANLALLMLGPGVSITHAAISVLADHGCLVAWCGEEGVRFYALGMGETRSAANFLHQARVWAHTGYRMEVVRRMYQLRFSEKFDPASEPSANPRHGRDSRARFYATAVRRPASPGQAEATAATSGTRPIR